MSSNAKKEGHKSLLSGRNKAPLTEEEIRRAAIVFRGLDEEVPARHATADVEGNSTRCRTFKDEEGHDACEVVFGPDLYPGTSPLDP
jgi:hypothetical protein